MELSPVHNNPPSLSTEYSVTHAADELTEALHNPAPSRTNPKYGEDKSALKQLAAIFNISILQENPPRAAQLSRLEHTPGPPQRRQRIQQPSMTVPPEPAPCKRVNRKSKITMTPGRAKRQLPQTEPHFIPDDTEAIPQLPHPYDGITCNVPLVHKYNTRSRRLKVHHLMANHVSTIKPPRQPST